MRFSSGFFSPKILVWHKRQGGDGSNDGVLKDPPDWVDTAFDPGVKGRERASAKKDAIERMKKRPMGSAVLMSVLAEGRANISWRVKECAFHVANNIANSCWDGHDIILKDGAVQSACAELDMRVLGWRDVPTDAKRADLGDSALATEPEVAQLFVARGDDALAAGIDFETQLYVLRPPSGIWLYFLNLSPFQN